MHPTVSAPRAPHAPWFLALDTSTDVLSIALGPAPDDACTQPPTWQYTGAGASKSSATLIPEAMRLLSQAGLRLQDLAALVVGSGPGSFTGLRTACSVAQGLALGAGLPVLPVGTLLAVAEDWRHNHAAHVRQGRVWALLDARMDEIYAEHWQWHTTGSGTATRTQWHCASPACLIKPEQLLQLPGITPTATCAGNVQAAYSARLPLCVQPAMPTAQAMLQLAPALLAQNAACDPALALPRYVRDKVAQTTAERAALQQATQHAQAATGTTPSA